VRFSVAQCCTLRWGPDGSGYSSPAGSPPLPQQPCALIQGGELNIVSTRLGSCASGRAPMSGRSASQHIRAADAVRRARRRWGAGRGPCARLRSPAQRAEALSPGRVCGRARRPQRCSCPPTRHRRHHHLRLHCHHGRSDRPCSRRHRGHNRSHHHSRRCGSAVAESLLSRRSVQRGRWYGPPGAVARQEGRGDYLCQPAAVRGRHLETGSFRQAGVCATGFERSGDGWVEDGTKRARRLRQRSLWRNRESEERACEREMSRDKGGLKEREGGRVGGRKEGG
jgi:hypothetical protein